jgi:hypothetical protein
MHKRLTPREVGGRPKTLEADVRPPGARKRFLVEQTRADSEWPSQSFEGWGVVESLAPSRSGTGPTSTRRFFSRAPKFLARLIRSCRVTKMPVEKNDCCIGYLGIHDWQ